MWILRPDVSWVYVVRRVIRRLAPGTTKNRGKRELLTDCPSFFDRVDPLAGSIFSTHLRWGSFRGGAIAVSLPRSRSADPRNKTPADTVVLLAALRESRGKGIVTANLEYRRVGQPGGGWPGTYEDVVAALEAASEHLGRAPVVVGHSAGRTFGSSLGQRISPSESSGRTCSRSQPAACL